MLSSVHAGHHGPHAKPRDLELKFGLAQWFREEFGQIVRGGYATEVDEAQLLLDPARSGSPGQGC